MIYRVCCLSLLIFVLSLNNKTISFGRNRRKFFFEYFVYSLYGRGPKTSWPEIQIAVVVNMKFFTIWFRRNLWKAYGTWPIDDIVYMKQIRKGKSRTRPNIWYPTLPIYIRENIYKYDSFYNRMFLVQKNSSKNFHEKCAVWNVETTNRPDHTQKQIQLSVF